MWVYPEAITGDDVIIDWRPSNTNGAYVNLLLANGVPKLHSNGDRITGSSALPVKTWSYLTLTRVSGSTKLYVNGTQTGSTYSDTNDYLTGSSRPVIGQAGYNPALGLGFNGYITDLIVKLSGNSSPSVPTSPVSSSGTSLHIKGTDASIIDKAQNSNLKQGSSSSNVVGATTITDPFGGALPSIYIPVHTHFIQTTNDIPAVGTGDFTGEAWVWRPSFTNYRTIMDNRTGSNTANRWHLAIDGSGQVYFYTNTFIITSSISLTINTWHHVAITRQNGTCRLFIDGTERGSATNTSSFNDTKFTVGSQTGLSNSFASGYIFDARFTIGLARYTSNFTPPTESLKG